jgi:hypothetical protein
MESRSIALGAGLDPDFAFQRRESRVILRFPTSGNARPLPMEVTDGAGEPFQARYCRTGWYLRAGLQGVQSGQTKRANGDRFLERLEGLLRVAFGSVDPRRLG